MGGCHGPSPPAPLPLLSGLFLGILGVFPSAEASGPSVPPGVGSSHLRALSSCVEKGGTCQGMDPGAALGSRFHPWHMGPGVLWVLHGGQGSIPRFPLCKTTDSSASWNSPDVCKCEIQAPS